MVTIPTPSVELDSPLTVLLLERPELVIRALVRLLAPHVAAEVAGLMPTPPSDPPAPRAARPKNRRRTAVRPVEHPLIIPSDIDQRKARDALAKMGLSRGK